MLSVDEARIRVARGAAHLDTVRPNWFTQIDVGTLDMKFSCHCIVGQLCGYFSDGIDTLAIADPVEYGVALSFFDGDPVHHTLESRWRPLQDAWIAAIADRRLAQLQIQEEDTRRVGRGDSARFGTAKTDRVVSDTVVSSDPCIEVTR